MGGSSSTPEVFYKAFDDEGTLLEEGYDFEGAMRCFKEDKDVYFTDLKRLREVDQPRFIVVYNPPHDNEWKVLSRLMACVDTRREALRYAKDTFDRDIEVGTRLMLICYIPSKFK